MANSNTAESAGANMYEKTTQSPFDGPQVSPSGHRSGQAITLADANCESADAEQAAASHSSQHASLAETRMPTVPSNSRESTAVDQGKSSPNTQDLTTPTPSTSAHGDSAQPGGLPRSTLRAASRNPAAPREPLSPGYQFLYDMTGDRERLSGLVHLIRVTAFAGVLLLAAAAGLAYILLQHDQVTAKFGVTAGSASMVALGGFLLRRQAHQRRRRDRFRHTGPEQPDLPALRERHQVR
jgi:hypothetical protein